MSETYSKVFRTMYSGSMYGAGMNVFAVWGWILAHKDENGMVEVNPDLVAHQLGGVAQQVTEALAYLTSPDPQSRSTEEEGRRLVKVSQFGYQVVNHARYADRGRDRSTYWRDYRAKRRATVAQQCAQVAQPEITHVDVDVDVDVEKKEERTASRSPALPSDSSKRFKPPTAEQVTQYARTIGYVLDGQRFIDHYTANGWRVGRNPMKCWKSAVRTWRSRDAKPPDPPKETPEGMLARLKSKGLM